MFNSFRKSLPIIGLFAACSGSPASAVTTFFAYNPYYAGPLGEGLSTTGPAIYTADSGPLRVSVNTERWVLPGDRNYAWAGPGRLRASSRVTDFLTQRYPYNHNKQGGAVAGFTDTVIFDTGTPGELGAATFAINFDGMLSSDNDTWSNFGNRVPLAGYRAETAYYLRGIDYDATGATLRPGQTIDVTGSRLYTVNFRSGVPIDIGLSLEVYTWYEANNFGYIIANSDFSHTASWGGLISATGGSGQNVTRSLAITSDSGFDYSRSLSTSIPEPATWVLTFIGFGAIGRKMRSRRRMRFGSAG